MAATRTTLEILLAFKDQLSGGLIKAEKGILSFAKRGLSGIKGLLGSLLNLKTAILGVGGALAIGGATSLVKRVADLGDKLLKTSQKTGITVESLSRLSHAAGMSGVDIDELGRSFVIAEKGIQGFRMGSKELEDVMALMGKEFEKAVLRGESMEQLLPEIIDGFNALGTEEEKVVVATKLFGKSGAELIPFLEEGRDKIEELFRESDRLRLTWSRGDAEAADTFGDAMDRLKGSMFGLLEEVIKPMLPTFTKWLDSLSEFIVSHRDDVLNFFAGLVDWGAQLADTVLPKLEGAFRVLFRTMKTVLQPVLKVGLTLASREYLNAKEELDVLLQEIEDEKAAGRTGNPNRIKLAEQSLGRARARMRAADEELMQYGAADRAFDYGLPSPPGSPKSLGDSIRARTVGPSRGGATSWSLSGQASPGRKVAGQPTQLDTVLAEIEKMRVEWIDANAQMSAATRQLGDSVVDNLAGGLTDAELRAKSFGEAFHDMGKGILTDLVKIINKMIVMRLIGAGITGLGSLFGGSGAGFSGSDVSFGPTNLGNVDLAAAGTPRTRGPTLAGEDGAEAVIPLSGGRYVPVDLGGNAGMTVNNNYYVNAIDTQSFDKAFQGGVSRNRGMIASVHQQQFQNRPEFRRSYR